MSLMATTALNPHRRRRDVSRLGERPAFVQAGNIGILDTRRRPTHRPVRLQAAQICAARESRLHKVPGFVEFHLLKGPEAEDHTLYASHTVWENRAVFEAWTKSEAFRAAHSRAGDNKPLYLDHPQFEGLRSVRRWDAARPRGRDTCALESGSRA